MTDRKLHLLDDARRRGESLPARLRISTRRGVSLVELMISMLILTFVCIAWFEIIGVQSARRESYRREAVERLAGMMDAFMYEKRQHVEPGYYRVDANGMNQLAFTRFKNDNRVYKLFTGEDEPAMGYRLQVVAEDGDDGRYASSELKRFKGWYSINGYSVQWLLARLYERGDCTVAEAKEPFFSVAVCLGEYLE